MKKMLQSDTRSACVLVADDNEDQRELIAEWLQQLGHRVLQASDGDIALELLKDNEVDLALLDVMMPIRTGLSTCEAIKSDARTCLLPVVLVTTLQDVDDRILGIEAGADDFITKPVSKDELLAHVRSLLRIKFVTDELESAETVIFSLALAIEAKDPYTEGHCQRLSKYSEALGKKLGLADDQLLALRRAGIVHDIGKVTVPDSILMKPGPLTPEERKVMESHTVTGEKICLPLKSFRLVTPIVRWHHEKLNGTGYPDGLKGDQIPLTARILTTVDLYDAMTTDRSYRKAMSIEDAFAQIRKEVDKGWWDAALVDGLEALLADS
jgi:putative two-component system response regulator